MASQQAAHALTVEDVLRAFPDSGPVSSYLAGWPLTRRIGAGELGEIIYYLDLPAAEVLRRVNPPGQTGGDCG